MNTCTEERRNGGPKRGFGGPSLPHTCINENFSGEEGTRHQLRPLGSIGASGPGYPVMNAAHNFKNDLAFSHDLEGADFWRQAYEYFFPGSVAVIRHSGDGDHQRAGIDTSVVMPNSKIFTVDEKLRRADYGDILLEEFSDRRRGVPGWICKALLADFVLYATPRRAFLLPVLQLQSAWATHGETWKATRSAVVARNRDPSTGRTWESVSWAVKPVELFPAIGENLRATFPSTNGIDGYV